MCNFLIRDYPKNTPHTITPIQQPWANRILDLFSSKKWSNNQLQGFVNPLNPTIQEPFILYYYGYDKEVADYLQWPLGTIRSHIFLAHKYLKATYAKNITNSSLNKYVPAFEPQQA